MLEHDSRYYNLETATFQGEDGSVISYKRRRFLPQPNHLKSSEEIIVTDGDRLDLIAARTFGDPEQFWRISDANNEMNPLALTDKIGRKLRIPGWNLSLDS